MKTTTKSFLSEEKIKSFIEIDGKEVLMQLCLFKGESFFGETKCVPFKSCEDMGLIHYGLQVTLTNRLYTGTYLMKYFKNNGLIATSGKIKIPMDIWEEAKSINDKYRINPTPNR